MATPPAAAAVPSNARPRLSSLDGRAGERAVTAREERLARPRRGEMKPETPNTPDDATSDFEQVQTDRADGRRSEAGAREDSAPEYASSNSATLWSCRRNALARKR